MGFKEAVRTCLVQKYFFRFSGRAGRPEFWWFMLFIALVNIVTGLVLSLFPPMVAASASLVISLMLLPANMGVTVRRLHDRNLRGWWLLLPITALLFWLVSLTLPPELQQQNAISTAMSCGMSLIYLVILMMPSQPGPNRFGPMPGSGNQ